MTTDLSNIRIMSRGNFDTIPSTSDNTLYFVEGGAEYSSGTSGFIIFPDGKCIQWGRVTVTSNGTPVTINLSKTYADTNYLVLSTINASTASSSIAASVGYASSASQAKAGCYAKNSIVNWMTIGQLASNQY